MEKALLPAKGKGKGARMYIGVYLLYRQILVEAKNCYKKAISALGDHKKQTKPRKNTNKNNKLLTIKEKQK